MIGMSLIVLLFLFLAAAFISVAEAAIISLSTLRMKRLIVFHPALTAYFSEWLAKPHRLIFTLMFLSNITLIAISSLSAAMVRHFDWGGIPLGVVEAVVWFVVTGLLLVFGEIAPKIIGRALREKVAPWIVPIFGALTHYLTFLFAPLNWLIEKAAPRLQFSPAGQLTVVSLEEFQHIIGESQVSGEVPFDASEMMRRVLALPQKTAADICQKKENVDVVALEVRKKHRGDELFVDLLVETGRSRVPVTRDGAFVGYVNVMDILQRWRSGEVTSVEELIRQAPAVSASRRVVDLLEEFRRSGENLAFVFDDQKRFFGLVTLEDALEEIVGEILDEYDLELKKGD